MSEARERDPAAELSVGRKLVFWLVTLLVPLCLFVAAEGLLRVAGVSFPDDPYLNLGPRGSFFTRSRGDDGSLYYKVTHPNAYAGRNIRFRAEKRPETFRAFCLGGSASAGWPHPAGESYSSYLEQALQRAFPERRIEVLNVSGHAYPAYRVRLLFHEVIEFDPDLIVLYSGNNEFLELRRYFDETLQGRLLTAASRLVLFQALQSSLMGLLFPENSLSARQREDVAWQEWSKIERRALELRSDPRQFERVKAHYRFSIESMVDQAGRRGVPVVLMTVPVNLRDWHPNVSLESPEGEARARRVSLQRAARGALASGEAVAAITALEEALALEPLHAESHFLLARALEASGDYARAQARYESARDLDQNPFRALSDFNSSLRAIALRYDSAYIADAEAAFRAASAPRAPGFDLFLDYVHPSKRGNLVAAETVFDAVLDAGLLGDGRGARFTHLPVPRGRHGGPYDETRFFRMQFVLLRLFGMMHQYESMIRKARALLGTPEARSALRATQWRFIQEVLDVFPPLVALERQAGAPPDRDRVEARVRRFYREHYSGYEEFRRRHGDAG